MTRHLVGPFIRRFLLEEVVGDRNLSINTQKSYRDAIRLLLRFVADAYSIEPTRLTVERLGAKVIRDFLRHLEEERRCSVRTRNQRLAAIHSLFRFIACLQPELVELAAEVRSIPLRRSPPPPMPYLDKREVDAILAAPDRRHLQGQRDYALLLFLYNTGARADEAARVTISDLRLDSPASVRLLGKGRKIRLCPIWPQTAEVLRALLGRRLDGPADAAAFVNARGQAITRFGIYGLVKRMVAQVSPKLSSLDGKRISPHTFRHSTAVHLLRAGVDINTIRAWLGHVSLETTNRYAEVDLEMKARALRMCAPSEARRQRASWKRDRDLMAFLGSL